ncbi:hypothetical protein VSF3289_02243 [Vibrio scophthalmi]|uniref:Uncharacterized protein n=1 Tax=Vibrio scophthalmi TaxID=45658 RepID=A0A1E3WQD9_9VIBR|nr:hypothetical protein VSF3289_02243 [Vibrio scophthalmi]
MEAIGLRRGCGYLLCIFFHRVGDCTRVHVRLNHDIKPLIHTEIDTTK